jgi:glucokinase
MYIAGVDIGGTNIKTGIVGLDGRVLKKSSIRTGVERPWEAVADDIAREVRSLADKLSVPLAQLKGVGVGCPGSINSETGCVDYANNIGWEGVPLSKGLSDRLGLSVRLCNDANAAALGEATFGAGRQYRDVVFITLGTGVGGGVIIGGKLFEGNESKGTELGHTVIQRGGELCTCGRRGCLEAYASATALIRDTKVAMRKNKDSLMWKAAPTLNDVSGRTAFDCAKEGDPAAKRVVDEYLEALGEGLCDFINIFRPEAIILGGGVCAQGDALLTPLRVFTKNFSYGGEHGPAVELLIATLGNDAGLIGAASLLL